MAFQTTAGDTNLPSHLRVLGCTSFGQHLVVLDGASLSPASSSTVLSDVPSVSAALPPGAPVTLIYVHGAE
jgi:hypothetical protein